MQMIHNVNFIRFLKWCIHLSRRPFIVFYSNKSLTTCIKTLFDVQNTENTESIYSPGKFTFASFWHTSFLSDLDMLVFTAILTFLYHNCIYSQSSLISCLSGLTLILELSATVYVFSFESQSLLDGFW